MLPLLPCQAFKSIKIVSGKNKKMDRQMVNSLDYGDIKFPASKKDYSKIGKRNSIYINVFGYGNGLIYPVYVSDEKFHISNGRLYGFIVDNRW